MASDGSVRDETPLLPESGGSPSTAPQSKVSNKATYLFDLNIVGYPVRVFSIPFMNGGVIGQWMNEPHELHLLENMNGPEQEADVLLHETIHAISDVSLGPEDRLSERQVNTLSTVLCDTIRRSPEFQDYLLGRLIRPETPEDV